MSFSLSFVVATVYEAKQQLQKAHAPAIVKAVIESALDRIPQQPADTQAAQGDMRQAGAGVTRSGEASSGPKPPRFHGVLVEAWGHFDESGTGPSEVQRLFVRPLFS